MKELYNDFKEKFTKLCESQNFQGSVIEDKYLVGKMQIGKDILLIDICENALLHIA